MNSFIFRFKLLPYSSDEEKSSTGELIKGMLTKVIEDQEPPTEEPVSKKSRLSGNKLISNVLIHFSIKQKKRMSVTKKHTPIIYLYFTSFLCDHKKC